jgi:hypothetical protein
VTVDPAEPTRPALTESRSKHEARA